MSNTVIRYYLQSLAKELLPGERIRVCMHHIRPTANGVDVLKKPQRKRAYYSGLMTCGLLWVCSVCAARITEERRQEMTAALAASDFTPYLLTYTLQHDKSNKLSVMLDGLLKAYRSLKAGRAWQGIKIEYGLIGSIRTLEISHGVNGWHPHLHELLLLDQKLSKSAQNGLLVDLKSMWGAALQRQNLDASWERGVDLRTADSDVRDYVAKFGHEPVKLPWSIEHEMTKQPVKKGRAGGRSPAQLLADYGEGDIQAGRLWREYAKVFKGRNQLVWSRGLREQLGLGKELTDQELAASLPDGLMHLARLTPTEWKAIIRADLRGEVLDVAGTCSVDEFSRWLSEKLEKWL